VRTFPVVSDAIARFQSVISTDRKLFRAIAKNIVDQLHPSWNIGKRLDCDRPMFRSTHGLICHGWGHLLTPEYLRDPLMELDLYSLLADLVLVIHVAFVLFVVVGFLLILIGLVADWSWVRNRFFRIAHLAAIGIVVLQAWFEQYCPLTVWENQLRRHAGEAAYSETFIEHWLHKVLFYQADAWIFTVIYTIFGVLVLLTWLFGGPRNKAD